DAYQRERNSHDLLDPPQTRLRVQRLTQRRLAQGVDPPAYSEERDQSGENGSDVVAWQEVGSRRRRNRGCHGGGLVWTPFCQSKSVREESRCVDGQTFSHGVRLGIQRGTDDLYRRYSSPKRSSRPGSSRIAK